MSLIIDTILMHLPAKRKQTPSGWISFNAPCCDDKRNRGGLIVNAGEAISYHCFNCQFKASWQPGRTISRKMRKFMHLLNMSDDVISQLSLEALRLNTDHQEKAKSIIPEFHARALPMDSALISDLIREDEVSPHLLSVLQYISDRGLYLDDFPFYWCDKQGFRNRLIVPFFHQQNIVGYTARIINSNANPRYISEQQPGYVFNLDRQTYDREFVLVCEGPFDAISIDACAIMGAEIKKSQDWLLRQLNREIVWIPDRDHEGPKTVENALDLGWSVSMPDWPKGVKDVNDAVCKIGRVATLWLIVQAKESNALKVRLRAKTWFKEVKK